MLIFKNTNKFPTILANKAPIRVYKRKFSYSYDSIIIPIIIYITSFLFLRNVFAAEKNLIEKVNKNQEESLLLKSPLNENISEDLIFTFLPYITLSSIVILYIIIILDKIFNISPIKKINIK